MHIKNINIVDIVKIAQKAGVAILEVAILTLT